MLDQNQMDLNNSQVSVDSDGSFASPEKEEWMAEKQDLLNKQKELKKQMEQLKGEFQKVIQEKPPKPTKKEKPEPPDESQSNQDVEKVLQPILEQITDETEGLLL